MSKSCKNCAKKEFCPWVCVDYCIEWTDKEYVNNTLNSNLEVENE